MTCRAIKSVFTAEKRKLRKCNMFGTKNASGGGAQKWKSKWYSKEMCGGVFCK